MRVPQQSFVLLAIGCGALWIARSLPESPSHLAMNQLSHQLTAATRQAERHAARDANPLPGASESVDAAFEAMEASDWPLSLSFLGEMSSGLTGDHGLGDSGVGEQGVLVQEPSRRTARRPSFEGPSKYNQRSSIVMLKAFSEAIGSTWKSTVELVLDDQRLAYGAIVAPDGWIVTKDSQMPLKGRVMCRYFDGNESLVEVVDRDSALDLALLKVPARDLPVIAWSEDALPARGSWIATTNIQSIPACIGVVSTGVMTINPRKAVLGVELGEDRGPVIQRVIYGSGADVAGLQSGDRIRAINGQKLGRTTTADSVLRTCRAGQSVQLIIERGENELETQVQLMDFAEDLRDQTEMEVNGSISARSSGFSTIFQHDTVLQPNQCGGPLVDLNGRVVGINIARAGRVSSYAIPASVARTEIDRMLAKAKTSQVVSTVR